MNKIVVRTIPHNDQAYNTQGDYYIDAEGNLQVLVSEMGNWRYSMLVAVHEIVEALLCAEHGVDFDAINQFDKQFEANRDKYYDLEPGDDPLAPYYKQHQLATSVERMLAAELGVSWHDYEDACVEVALKYNED